MNLYLVVSEQLREAVYEDWFNNVGHWEDYAICELVVARSRDHAKWQAWRGDRSSYTGDARDMPKFRIRLKQRNVDGPARLASSEFAVAESGPLWMLEPESLDG